MYLAEHMYKYISDTVYLLEIIFKIAAHPFTPEVVANFLIVNNILPNFILISD